MSLSIMFAGRKKESNVWKYFEYKADIDKSVCLVAIDNKVCSMKLAGKNSTNLKVNALSTM